MHSWCDVPRTPIGFPSQTLASTKFLCCRDFRLDPLKSTSESRLELSQVKLFDDFLATSESIYRSTLPSGEKPDSPIQNRKHSVGSMEAERGRLALDREVNLIHKALPGTSGDEDEAREIPHWSNAPKSKARLKGKSKRPKNSTQEWSGGKERRRYGWVPPHGSG
ncbi:hypothetical protein C8R44DRAFT_747503 [Mycena epipterygia]|nr:hypothetical protein C8R44DRAFT_747503 [Mycena epipterygia]